MPINYDPRYNDDHNVIEVFITQPWTVEEFMQISDEYLALMDTFQSEPIHAFVHAQLPTLKPSIMTQVDDSLKHPLYQHSGLIVVIDPPPFTPQVMAVVKRLAPDIASQIYTAATVEEAYEILDKHAPPKYAGI